MSTMQNKGFWVGAGVAAVAAVGVFAGLVLPKVTDAGAKRTAIKKATTEINLKVKEMPGDKSLEAWDAYAKNLKKEYKAHSDVLSKRDVQLERWFADMNPNATFDEFIIKYGEQARLLEKRMRDALVKVGIPRKSKDPEGKEVQEEDGDLGFNWAAKASFKDAMNIEEQLEAKAQLQKRFWLCEYVANAILSEEGIKPSRLIDLHFLHPSPIKGAGRQKFTDIHAGGSGSGGGGGETADRYKELTREQVLADRARMYQIESPAAPSASGTFVEYQLPQAGEAEEGRHEKSMGWTITFGLSLECEYAAIPKIVRNFMAGRQGSELPVQVVGINVFVPDQNPFKMEPMDVKAIDPTFVIPKFDSEQRQESEEWKTKFKDRRKDQKPARARAILLCQAVDFDPASLPAWAR